MKIENIKNKMVEVKDKVEGFWRENGTTILIVSGSVAITWMFAYFKGAMDGIKTARSEWDFGNDTGDWAVLMEENGEFKTALPIVAIREVMENHKVKEWTKDMWRSR